MVKFPVLIIFLIFSPPIFFSENNRFDSETTGYGSWKLERNDKGIKIFTRWVDVGNDLKVRQLKGEMTCEYPAFHIKRYISEDRIASQWMSRVLEHKNIEQINSDEWISYTKFNLPWPFNNQDLIVRNTVIQSGNNIVIEIEGLPDYLPEKDGVTRIQNFEGMWKLSNLGSSKTTIEYIVVTKSKAKAPRWITDPIVQNNFWETMNNLHNMLHDRSVRF